jgi:hypothetical protein
MKCDCEAVRSVRVLAFQRQHSQEVKVASGMPPLLQADGGLAGAAGFSQSCSRWVRVAHHVGMSNSEDS